MSKIFFICPIELAANDAPSLHVIQLANAFSTLGNKVYVFAPNISKLKTNVGFSVIYIPAFKFFISLLFQPLLSIVLFYKILMDRPNFIYFRISPFLLLPLFVAWILKVPLIAEVNGVQNSEMKILGGPILKFLSLLRIFWISEYLSYKLSKCIICVTAGIKDYVIKDFKITKSKIFVVNNGVDTQLFEPVQVKSTDENADKSEITFGYIGGFHVWQGIEFIVDAFSIVNQRIPKSKLVLAGSGNTFTSLKSKVKKMKLEGSIIFPGAVPHVDVPRLMNTFDICLSYPTSDRSFVTSPFKIYEYLACGKATIVSNIPGVGDIFRQVTIQALPENSIDLSEKMIAIAQNSNLRHEIGKRARKYIIDGHSWKSVAIEILKRIENSL